MLKSRKLQVFDEADEKSADELQKIFNIKSQDEVEEILKRTERLQKAASYLRDESSDALEGYHEKNWQMINRALKQNFEAFTSKRDLPDKGIDRIIDEVYNRKKVDPENEYPNYDIELDRYHKYMLNDEIIDKGDPQLVMQEAHD